VTLPASITSLPRTDQLAVERTLLANERTFLAYFRTSVVFLTSGLAIRDIEFFSDIRYLSALLIVLGPLTFMVGLYRSIQLHRRILRYGELGTAVASPGTPAEQSRASLERPSL